MSMMERISEYMNNISAKFSKFAGDVLPHGLGNKPTASVVKQLFDHHMISGLLPYEMYDEETSLFINRRSRGFILEVSTLIGSSEEIENILSSIITDSLPHTVDMQFLLWASPKIKPILDGFSAYRSKNEMFSWLANKRVNYLQEGSKKSLSSFGSLLLRDFKLFITVSVLKKQEDGESLLISLRDDLESSLKSINMASKRINAQEFISIFSDIVSPSSDISPSEFRWNELDSLATQSLILNGA
jgi:conjugal transfer ATP-binding protein TraC